MRLARLGLAALALAVCAAANGLTGDLQIFSGGQTVFFGFCKNVSGSCGRTLGSAANTILSDGKEVIGFYDTHGGQPTGSVFLAIRGFTSNPGRGYITSVTVRTCQQGSSTLPATSAGFVFTPVNGVARWEWGRPPCLIAATNYGVSIRGPN